MPESYVTLECEWCDSEYERHRSCAEGSRFCSTDCQHACRKENDGYLSGPSHPAWGGKVNSDTLRGRVLERDDYLCQCCGVSVERGGRAGQVHHIIPRAAGGSDTPVNLITLCKPCHRQTHRYVYEEIEENHPEILDGIRKIIMDGGGR